jgi:predicted dehydrogenase
VSKLRLGVIGAGFMAVYSHIPILAARDDVALTGVCRLAAEPLRLVQEQFGFEHASENYRDILDLGLDLVVVASPPSLHFEHASAALDSGAHVLCEKPFTLAPEDAWSLVRQAEAQDRHLVLAFGWNYKEMTRTAKQLANEGVGDIEHVEIHMASVTRELLQAVGDYHLKSDITAPEAATWTDPRLSGGGFAQAQLSHALGLALWLTDLRGAEVFARMHDLGGTAPVELHNAFSISYTNGAIGTMSGASCPAGAGKDKQQLEVKIFGSDGMLVLDYDRELIWHYRDSEREQRLVPPADSGRYDCIGPPNALVDLALGAEVENCSPAFIGARTVEIIEAGYRSASSGRSEPCYQSTSDVA